MKLENQQSTITNPQFSGGRMIGSGSNTGNSSLAVASIAFTGITTGSTSQAKAAATITGFGDNTVFRLTGSNAATGTFYVTSSATQVDAPPTYYVVSGSTVALTVANIATEINNYSSTFGITALASASILQLTASAFGVAGNSYNFISASTTTTLAGGLTLGTGSFTLTDTFGVTNRFTVTSSNQATANLNATQSVNGSTFYVAGGATQAATISNIAAFLNVSASAIVLAASSSTNLILTSSINGAAGNNVYVVSGSTTTNLAGGVGTSDYPYTFPFVAGGLYVGQIGTLQATTVDGSALTLYSASGFIPGIFQSVTAYPTTTAIGIIALK
jgi:hypothetical protein